MVGDFTPPDDPGAGTGGNTGGGTGGGTEPPVPSPGETTEGSGSSTYQEILSTTLLSYLSSTSRAKILSCSNIGSSTLSIIQKSLETIDKLEALTVYLVDETILNSLGISAESQPIQLQNVGTSQYVRITVNITEAFSPAATSPKLTIKNGSIMYYVNLDSSNAARKIIFNNIPASFCVNFSVINNTGTALPSFGNSIFIQAL